jgi:MYXO-CTERM domain-containing protein
MRRSVSLLSLVAIGTLTGQAAAVMPNAPASGPAAGVLQPKTGDPIRALVVGTGAAPAARASAWSKFRQVAGGVWTGLWDEVTGVPMTVHGEGIAAPGSVNNAAAAEQFTRAFIAQHIALLAPGASPSDIQLVDNITDGEMRTLGFVQTHRGMRVLDAHLIFEFKNDRLFVFGSTALPNVSVPESAVNAPLAAVKSSATGWMGDMGRTLVANNVEETVILPLVRESGAIEYHRVTPVEVTEPNAMGSWTVYVDTASGVNIARKDNLTYVDGTLKYKVPERSPGFGMRVDRPAALANITVGGTAGKSDNYGKVTWTAAGDATVTANAVGTLVSVNNNTASGAKVTGMVPVPAGGIGIWDRSTVALEDAQLVCFTSINVVKEHVSRVVPRGGANSATGGSLIAWIDTQLVCNVNQPSTCNANWNGTSVQFFAAGKSGTNNCENTGRITDVVYHEFGHGFHSKVVTGGGAVNGSMGEGVGDTLSASITQDFKMAPGFFVDRPTEGIRDLDTTDATWPPPNTEVHAAGVVYGGWMYDLRKNFKAMYGDKEGNWQCDRLFYESVRRATSIPTSVTQVFAADDDDGNTANGTLNTCAVYEAAKRHTLFASGTGTPAEPPAASLIPGVAAPTLTGSTLSLKLLGNTLCPTPVDLQSAVAAYQPRGSTTQTMVTLTKGTNEYTGTLPAAADTVGTYKVTATFANGKVYTFPQNAADPMYEYYTGAVTKLYCTDFEGATAPADWTHTGTPTTADEWEWGTPGEIALTNDPRSAFSGTKVFGMDLGKWTTDGVYPTGTSSLQSPVVNTAGMGQVHLQYRRQLNVETGSADQATIYANGTKVWGNATTGNHTDKEWRFHDVDLTAQAASGTVQVKFEIVANAMNNFGGWNIDDFCIVATQGDGGTPPQPPDAGGDGGAPDASIDASTPDSGDGAVGTGGSAGTAGAAGAAGKGGASGAAGSGGAAGKAGASGAAGSGGASGAAGSGGASGAAGAGGSAGTAGAAGKGGTGGSGTGGSSTGAGGTGTTDDGCSCRIGAAPHSTNSSIVWLTALPLVGLGLRRRRRSASQGE